MLLSVLLVSLSIFAGVRHAEKVISSTKTAEESSLTSDSPSSEGDTRLGLSPKSKGRRQSVEGSDSSNTKNTDESHSSSNPSATATSQSGRPASSTVPSSCGSLPAGAGQVPFSCFDQGKLKDYCSQTFGTASQADQVTPGNRKTGLKIYTVDKTRKANWFEALGLCLSRNMSLATVESFDEQKALATALNTEGGIQNAWLSAADLGQTNRYVWMSTGLPVTWTNWYKEEPNHENSGNETEHCVEVINYRWKWNDNLCNNQEYFVCQYYTDN